MNCPRCNAPNEPEARFCKNCGLPFFQYPPVSVPVSHPVSIPTPVNDKQVIYVLLLLAWNCVLTIISMIVNHVIVPFIQGPDRSGHWETVSMVYSINGWFNVLTNIILSVVVLVLSKNKWVKIVVIAFLVLRVIELIIYYILPLFEKKNDFVYFQF